MKTGHSNPECLISRSGQMKVPWHPLRYISTKQWAAVQE